MSERIFPKQSRQGLVDFLHMRLVVTTSLTPSAQAGVVVLFLQKATEVAPTIYF
jgi:hypothetical protein